MSSIHSITVIVATAFIAAMLVSSPAAATDTSQARELCKKNPDCSEMGTNGGSFCIHNKQDNEKCDHIVVCGSNDHDHCVVAYIKRGGGKKRLGSKAVAKVLTGGANITTKKPSRALGGGLLDSGPGLSSPRPGAVGAPAAAPPPPKKLY